MVGHDLLQLARAAGLTVWADGDRVRLKGPRRLEPLVREVLDHQDSVLVALRQEVPDEFTQAVMDAFGGELVQPSESCLMDPATEAPGIPSVRVSTGRKRKAVPKAPGGPEFGWDKCRPGPGPEAWTERVEATEPSIFESMHRRESQVERMDIRGLGKRGRRPTSWNGGRS